MSHQMKCILMLGALLALGLQTAYAQQAEATNAQAGGNYHRIAQPGDITMRITVWGSVETGLYDVTEGMHLSTLFTLVGGSTSETKRQRDAQVHLVRVLRDEGGKRVVIYEASMNDGGFRPDGSYIFADDPVLQNGDIVIVQDIEQKTRLGWQSAWTAVSLITSALFLVDRLIVYIR